MHLEVLRAQVGNGELLLEQREGQGRPEEAAEGAVAVQVAHLCSIHMCVRGYVYYESDRIFWRRPRKDQLQCRSLRVRVRVRLGEP